MISMIGLVANYFYLVFDGVLVDNCLEFILIILLVILSFKDKNRDNVKY